MYIYIYTNHFASPSDITIIQINKNLTLKNNVPLLINTVYIQFNQYMQRL